MRPAPTGARLTQEDYEYCYAEALTIIRNKMTREIVGQPNISSTACVWSRLVAYSTTTKWYSRWHGAERQLWISWGNIDVQGHLGRYDNPATPQPTVLRGGHSPTLGSAG
jgi:hypothetical protein